MQKVNDTRPKAQNITVIYLLFTKQLKFDVDKQLGEWHAQNFMAIAESVNIIVGSEVDTFWISKQLAEFLSRHSDQVVDELVQMCHRQIANGGGTSKLYR